MLASLRLGSAIPLSPWLASLRLYSATCRERRTPTKGNAGDSCKSSPAQLGSAAAGFSVGRFPPTATAG